MIPGHITTEDGYRLAYVRHGPEDAARTVLCVHGLTRNGRDFDRLAATLAGEGSAVLCPDMIGRGQSDWAREPARYAIPHYMRDIVTLLASLGLEQVDWVGTSMGALIGMAVAALPGTTIRRLVLNDAGPFIPKAALERLATYVGQEPRFASLEEAEVYLRRTYADFGPMDDEAWWQMALHGMRKLEDGSFAPAYDPHIGDALAAGPIRDVESWGLFQAIRAPMLVVRGALSDLLTAETAAEMLRRNPGTGFVAMPDCGHAPSLTRPEQIAPLAEFLSD